MAAETDMTEYQYSLQGLDLSQAQAAQDLLTVLKQESDTFELAEARDSLAQQEQDESLVAAAAQPQKTWLLWANAKNGKQLQVGIASIADGEVGIAILAEHQGRGLGRLTMEALIDWAKKVGYDRLWLDVDETNEVARHLYHTLGFVEVGEDTMPILLQSGRQANLVKMELILA
ncbi:GNAT family acetyltransferase [Fructobacillus pseudoficulneus]|uniref:GNAT family acetyltransferase n=1 Tax=Fructobacillus pseudoficulneus TaxID=220714 RepID=A0A3F3H2I8_9LACO|nr:GNAT family N-acetyltransferase [Fructobacillus pseudoficulneus]GAP02778.1 GNAT family acetyltransferase [Fructobacillus pseudoficulneus]SEH39829.1 Acetyltransferase (GNAT) family protein [Fructobacillus pseudoficulneus]